MIGRIVRSVDFERVLSAPTRARTSHFAVHHVLSVPSLPQKPAKPAMLSELSTSGARESTKSVDDSPELAPIAQSWLGAVVPKRHARRAVTRSLLKRQIRAAVGRQRQLPGGLWVVRLRALFDRQVFVSASSTALQKAARDELDALLASAVRRSAGA